MCADGQMFPVPYDDYTPDQAAAPGYHYMSTYHTQTQENVDTRKVFVGQLPKDYTEEHIYAIFAQFGNIEDITLLRNESNESKCCGFVTYKYRLQALGAIRASSKVKIDAGGRPLVVRLANSRRR